MTEANKYLDSLKDGYDEVKIHEMISLPKIRLQGIMQEYADKQFAIQLVSQKRELLVAYEKRHYTPSEWVLASKQCEKEIDYFLATNCG